MAAVGLLFTFDKMQYLLFWNWFLFTNKNCKHTKHYNITHRSGYVDGGVRTELLPVLHSTDQFWLADPTPKALIWCIGKVTKFTEAPKLWILPHNYIIKEHPYILMPPLYDT